MTDYTELKRLAKAAGSVEWKWWESNSTLRLTTEVNGRHGADGDAISAYRDSVHCPEPLRAFIECSSPAAILAMIAEIQRLDENPGMRAIRSLRADCKDLMAERDQLKAENEALRQKAVCVDDCVHLIRKLVYCRHQLATDGALAEKALDYLQRKGLQGSPLRAEDRGVDPEQQAAQQSTRELV